MTLAERILLKVRVDPTQGCWLWTGAVNPKTGYASLRVNGKKEYVHRIAHVLWVGPIPPGLQIDHTCHNRTNCAGGSACQHRRCLNPRHLEAVTHRLNIRRSPVTLGGINARRTHCIHGHPFVPENMYVNSRGHRTCLTCRRAVDAIRNPLGRRDRKTA